MLLTVSKRIEFSASRRLFDSQLSEAENRARFGDESAALYGSGRNYVAYFVFSGTPDSTTGMLINISEIKERAGGIIAQRYDHRFLNADNPAFAASAPTVENVARHLFVEAAPLFEQEPASLAAVHLRESPSRSATAYASGATDSNYTFEFSAARRTVSPHLSDDENQEVFGPFAQEHGHHYRARMTFGSDHSAEEIAEVIGELRSQLDRKHLNHGVNLLKGAPITTETIARTILHHAAVKLPVTRVRLFERDDFFAEAWIDGQLYLGMRAFFGAAHRLHVASFSDEKNAELFGKCNNPGGHGHFYTVEATIGGEYDARSGTLFSFSKMSEALENSLQPWRDKHLDREIEDFRAQPSTGENIVRTLWEKLAPALENRLTRLRLWETANNCFTLRRA